MAETPPRKMSALQMLKAAKRAEMKKSSSSGDGAVVDMVSRDGMVRGEVGLVYDERMLLHHCPWDPHHIESPDRLSSIWSRCSELGLVDRCVRMEARAATDQELTHYHTDKFLDKFASSQERSVEVQEVECRAYDSVYMSRDTEMTHMMP